MGKQLAKVIALENEGDEVTQQSQKENRALERQAPADFKIRSEHYEKEVALRSLTDEEKNIADHSRVTIFRDDGVECVDPERLEELIKSNKRIKKVVIEKISVEDAARISMLFKPNKIERKGSLKIGNSKSLEEIEEGINKSFINRPSAGENLGTIANSKRVLAHEVEPLFPHNNSNIEFLKNKKVTQEEPQASSIVDEYTKHFEEDKSKKENNDLALKTEHNNKKVLYDRHTITRRKGTTHNGYYYRAKDHMELFKVGSSYLSDYKNGLKSLSFIGQSLEIECEKSVFGVLSFFNYHIDLNICVITSDFIGSFYQEIMGDLEINDRDVFDEDFSYKVHSGKGFDLISFRELMKVERKLRQYDFEYFLDVLIENYDLILWDLPTVDILNTNKELYFPVIRSVDNVSIIVKENTSKFNDINETISYFRRYQIGVKGLLVAKNKDEG